MFSGSVLSMGYGFVEFKDPKDAKDCIKKMQVGTGACCGVRVVKLVLCKCRGLPLAGLDWCACCAEVKMSKREMRMSNSSGTLCYGPNCMDIMVQPHRYVDVWSSVSWQFPGAP